ncbi:small integral membrane protein 2 [Apodemus sylvaticus]|uniref:small integral membrane protein 2 n=1 Tax=Apodemus sylvaticus TaxID=10129 RepID=UPI002244C8F1|nr:small integral membrane protein 2 [Apodemus sylvaticus]
MPARLHRRETETRGCATSVLFCFPVSFICDTYIVLAWNSRVKSSPDAHGSFDELHTSIQQNRRLWERGSHQAPEQIILQFVKLGATLDALEAVSV